MHDFFYYIHFDHADDVEVSKTHKNSRIKYDILDITGLNRWLMLYISPGFNVLMWVITVSNWSRSYNPPAVVHPHWAQIFQF